MLKTLLFSLLTISVAQSALACNVGEWTVMENSNGLPAVLKCGEIGMWRVVGEESGLLKEEVTAYLDILKSDSQDANAEKGRSALKVIGQTEDLDAIYNVLDDVIANDGYDVVILACDYNNGDNPETCPKALQDIADSRNALLPPTVENPNNNEDGTVGEGGPVFPEDGNVEEPTATDEPSLEDQVEDEIDVTSDGEVDGDN